MSCVRKIKDVVHDTLIKHGVERHLPYAVCMEDGGVQCVIKHGVERHLPYLVCVCVWKMKGMVHDTLIEHGVERHLLYVVCAKNGGCGA